MGLFWRHLHSCSVVAAVNVVVTHRAADQDLHTLGEVIEFGGQQEIVRESRRHAAAHRPHPVHLQMDNPDQSLDVSSLSQREK